MFKKPQLFCPPNAQRGPRTHLQVVGDEQLPEVVHLKHGGGVVLTDAVALQQVLGGHHLPGQPAQVEGRVARQHVREVSRLAAAARVILLHPLRDGLHLSLLTVRAWKVDRKPVRSANQLC